MDHPVTEKQKNNEENSGARKRRKIASLCSLAGLLLFFAIITLWIGKSPLESISNPEQFRVWVDRQGALGPLTLVGVMGLQVVIGVIPGEPIEIGAGYAFGPWWGLLLCLIGAAIGSILILLFTKQFGIKMVEAFVSREKINSLKFIRSHKRLNLLVFLLFLIPGSPKDILTYLVGLTPMKITTFLFISSIARIPSVISSTLGGDALGSQNYGAAVLIFAVTALISLAGILVYRKIVRKEEQKEKERLVESFSEEE